MDVFSISNETEPVSSTVDVGVVDQIGTIDGSMNALQEPSIADIEYLDISQDMGVETAISSTSEEVYSISQESTTTTIQDPLLFSSEDDLSVIPAGGDSTVSTPSETMHAPSGGVFLVQYDDGTTLVPLVPESSPISMQEVAVLTPQEDELLARDGFFVAVDLGNGSVASSSYVAEQNMQDPSVLYSVEQKTTEIIGTDTPEAMGTGTSLMLSTAYGEVGDTGGLEGFTIERIEETPLVSSESSQNLQDISTIQEVSTTKNVFVEQEVSTNPFQNIAGEHSVIASSYTAQDSLDVTPFPAVDESLVNPYELLEELQQPVEVPVVTLVPMDEIIPAPKAQYGTFMQAVMEAEEKATMRYAQEQKGSLEEIVNSQEAREDIVVEKTPHFETASSILEYDTTNDFIDIPLTSQEILDVLETPYVSESAYSTDFAYVSFEQSYSDILQDAQLQIEASGLGDMLG